MSDQSVKRSGFYRTWRGWKALHVHSFCVITRSYSTAGSKKRPEGIRFTKGQVLEGYAIYIDGRLVNFDIDNPYGESDEKWSWSIGGPGGPSHRWKVASPLELLAAAGEDLK